MASLFTGGFFQAIDENGVSPGALLYTYASGTLTPLATYTDQAGTAPNANPVVCNSLGQAAVWLGSNAYRFILKNAAGVDIGIPMDNILGDPGFLQSGSGAVSRSIASKLQDTVSVADFGAVGDGTTDDTVAIEAAIATRKTVFFPKPSSYYKVTGRVVLYYNSHLVGEEGVNTIIRRTDAAGAVFEFVGSNENASIENLRIGGTGCVGIRTDGGGYTNYLSTLSLRNVHFESDLLQGINADMIHCNFEDCTFGYFTQTLANTNFQAVVSSTGGAGNTNVNRFENCKFFNGGATKDTVSFTSGMVLTFVNCAWENNGRALGTSSIQNVVLLNCYAERTLHATSQFDFNQSRGRMKVIGGQYNGGSMPTAAAMFRASSDAAILIEDADITTGSDSFTFTNASNGLHTLLVSGVHHIKDCRIQGNASDPLIYLDNIIEGAVYSFTPVPVSLTVVNGSGGATYSGTYSISNRIVTWTLRIVTTGTCTTAATAGTTYFPFPSTLPSPQVPATGAIHNEVAGTSLGAGLAYTSNRFICPVWTAQQGSISMSGSYAY